MGKKGNKQYIRICGNPHSQFDGYKLPVGSYYGRDGDTLFVLNYGSDHGKKYYKVDLKSKVGKDENGYYDGTASEWHKGKVQFGSEIGNMIYALIRERGNPKTKKYNRKREKGNKKSMTRKELREIGAPMLVGTMEPNLTGGRNYSERETENNYEPFIKDSIVVNNEDAYWMIYKDVNRKSGFSKLLGTEV